MKRRIWYGLTAILVFLAAVGLACASQASPQDIYNDYAADGGIDGTYTTAELRSYLADATLDQYGDPAVLLALDTIVLGMLKHRAEGIATADESVSYKEQGGRLDGAMAIIWSVIGAAVFAFIQWLWRLGRVILKKNSLDREGDKKRWLEGDPATRQDITYKHLFIVLGYYLLGSLLLTIPTVAAFASTTSDEGARVYTTIISFMGGFAFASYVVALLWVVRYVRLRASRPTASLSGPEA